MADLQPRPFTDMRKPTVIPFIGDTRPSKGWDFSEYSDKNSFSNRLNQNMSEFESKNLTRTQKQAFSAMVSTMQMATIKKGLDNFSHGHLSNIEFVADKQNYEKVNKPDYVDYRNYLYTPLDKLSKAALQPTEDDDEDDIEETDEEDLPSEGHTISHNLNLYGGFAGFNPFKKGDSANFNAFNSDRTMQMLTSNFMSPLRTLGQDVWNEVNYHVSRLQERSAKLEDVPDFYYGNDVETFDILSNYESVLRDYSENPAQRERWNENWFASFILRRWSDAKNFFKNATLFSGRVSSHVGEMELYESKDLIIENDAEFDGYVEELDAMFAELETLTEESQPTSEEDELASEEEMAALTSTLEDMLTLLDDEALGADQQEQLDALKAQYEGYALPTIDDVVDTEDLSKAEDWWNRVGDQVPDSGMLMPMGVFAESAGAIAGALELGNWGGSLDSTISGYISDEAGGFMDRAFTSYMSFIADKFLPVNEATGIVTAEDLAIDNVNYGQTVFDHLRSIGIISADGRVSSNFDPDDTTFNLGITDDFYENDRIRAELRAATLGSFDLERFDIARNDSREREQIRLIDPEGNRWTLPELQELIGSGDTLAEQYDNTRKAYNVLFDMYEAMTGMSVNADGNNGQPMIREKDNGVFEMTVYPHSEWKEFHDKSVVAYDENGEEYLVGSWADSGDQPLKMQFSSSARAEQFFDDVHKMISSLEPILGSMEPTSDVGPGMFGLSYQNGDPVKTRLRVINDNEGMLGTDGVVLRGSDDHKIHVDYVHHQSYFETDHWNNVGSYLSDKIIYKIGYGIFVDSQVNRIHKMRNRREKQEYKEKKKEHDAKEYERIRNEMRNYLKQISKQKKFRKEHAAKVEKRFKELLEQTKKMDKLKEQRLKEAREKQKVEESRRKEAAAAKGAGSSSKKRK